MCRAPPPRTIIPPRGRPDSHHQPRRLQGHERAEQDALAAAILGELESERRWDDLFQRAADTLSKLGKEALAEDRAGRTRPLDELL